MTAVNYLWNPINDNIVREFDDTGVTVAEYTTEPDLYGNVVSQYRDEDTRYLRLDGQGNTTELTNDAGNVTDTIRYSAFGKVTEIFGTTELPLQYLGEKGYYRDKETGEHYVRTRPLLGSQGRWLAVDPLGVLSDYTYADNKPLMLVDASGLLCIFPAFDTKTDYMGCGGLSWNAKFVPESKTMPIKGNVYIVQKLTWFVDIVSCDGKNKIVSRKCKQGDKLLTDSGVAEQWIGWELFWMRDGKLIGGKPPDEKELKPETFIDQFQHASAPDHKGTAEIRGSAQVFFAADKPPPGGWDAWFLSEQSPTKGMPMTCTNPIPEKQMIQTERTADKSVRVEFSCCLEGCPPEKKDRHEIRSSIEPKCDPLKI